MGDLNFFFFFLYVSVLSKILGVFLLLLFVVVLFIMKKCDSSNLA